MLDSTHIDRIAVDHRVLILSIGLILASCTAGDAGSCLDDLSSHRASIDADYANGDESPLSDEQKAVFTGLEYFTGDDNFCVEATFTVSAESEVFEMPTFNEASLPFREYGTFRFSVGGSDHSLTAYQRMDLPEDRRQWVLVPFKDATNGRGTYGGGRYLEIDLPIDSSTTIDFNRGSNPWCAYDPGYVCPVPPSKNWLNLRIEAGEKAFKTDLAESV